MLTPITNPISNYECEECTKALVSCTTSNSISYGNDVDSIMAGVKNGSIENKQVYYLSLLINYAKRALINAVLNRDIIRNLQIVYLLITNKNEIYREIFYVFITVIHYYKLQQSN